MQDIRRPFRHSKSKRDIGREVESFERREYATGDADDSIEVRKETIVKRTPRFGASSSVNLYPEYRKPVSQIAGRSKRSYFYIGMLLLAFLFLYIYTYFFNTAVLTVVPKYKDLTVNDTFKVGTDTDIPLLLATTTLTESKKLPKGGKTTVEKKATGEIIVYNNYSDTPQRLIKNTRFESLDGKIFRIQESIVIPAKKGSVPGSIKTKVYADEIGDSYNIAPTDFSLPAFKGTDKYKLFYARSSATFTGGASGERSVVATSDINAAKDELALMLTSKLKEAAKTVTKAGYIGMYNTVEIVITDNKPDVEAGKTDEYTATATAYVPFIKSEDLALKLAQGLSQYKGEHLRLDGTESLQFTPEKGASVVASSTFSLLVEGSPRIVWVVDGETLRQSLVGKTKDDLAGIIASTKEVDTANVDLRPFWVSTFPDRTGSIAIVEKLPVSKSTK